VQNGGGIGTARPLVAYKAKIDVVNRHRCLALGVSASNRWGERAMVEFLPQLGMDATNFDHTGEESRSILSILDEEDQGTVKEVIEQYHSR